MRFSTIERLEERRLFTSLIFQPATGSFAAGSALPQAYGSRVTAAIQNGYRYGTTGGYTPNVVPAYGANGVSIINEGAGYGTLTNVVTTANHAVFQMSLTADLGYQVALTELDMGGLNIKGYEQIKSVQVLDGSTGKILYQATNAQIWGSGTYPYSRFVFGSSVKARQLIVRYDDSNLTGAANVGVGAATFSQIAVGTGVINGMVFHDANGNGIKDAGEVGQAGVKVYLDLADSGVYNSADPTATTSSTGTYSFTVNPGTYYVKEIVPSGYKQTAPTTEPSVTVAATKTATVANIGNVALTSGPVVSVPNVSVAPNSTASVQFSVSDTNSAASEDIEGMTFTIQIAGGTGTTPSIQSVDVLTGTIWAGSNAFVSSPSGGQQAQFKTYSILTGNAGIYVNPNGLLATAVFNTAGAAAGSYKISLVGTRYPGFDSAFYNGKGNTVSSVFGSATLTVT